jgi:hypothetical protein
MRRVLLGIWIWNYKIRSMHKRKILLFLCCFAFASAAPKPRSETITGRVVAYSPAPTCFNGNAYWSVAIQVQRSSRAKQEFARVELSLPCGETPEWISAKSRVRKFRLIRNKDCDAVMESSAPFEPGDQRFPLWKPVSGAEDAALPFGRFIPCYHSVDFPLAPVM